MAGTCANPTCTANGTKRCARCKTASYCSSSCQKQDWRHHKPTCHSPTHSGTSAKTVMIHSEADGGVRYSQFLAPRTHSVFETSPAPISLKIGYPLLVHRPSEEAERGPAGDNQHATWLMIDPVTGFAPAEWQRGVGNVIVARADGEALDTATLGAVTDYVSDIVDAFGDGVEAVQKYYSRARLDKYIADHLKMQKEFAAFQGQQGHE